MKRLFMNRILGFCVFLVASLSLHAQHNLTMYNMHTLPQRIDANPAQISDSRFFIGFPGLSGIHVLYGNTGFKLNQLMSVSDSNTLQIHPMKFYNALNASNRISLDVDYDLLYVGFKARKSFFTIGMGEKVNTQFTFPKDFFGLFLIGNAGENIGKDLNFNFGFDLMAYNDIHASWSRAFRKDKLRLGVKASYLNGLVNINTERSDLTFKTHPDDFHYTIRSDVKVNTSSIVDTLDENFGDNTEFDPNIFKGRNRGMALSFGATYQLIPKLVLSASVANLGYIDWKDNVTNYKTKDPTKTFEFYGLEVNNFFNDSANIDNSLNDVLDTLKDKLELETTHKAYRTTLPATFYLGANFWITKKQNFAVLFYGNYYQKKLNPAITLSYNAKFTNVLGFSLSYSMINKKFNNGGVGLTLNGSAFQYYLVFDNLLGIIKYRNANTVDLRMGINFTFLRKVKQPGLSGKKKL